MWDKVKRYYHTIKYLKSKQIRYLLKYRVFGATQELNQKTFQDVDTGQNLQLKSSLVLKTSYFGNRKFSFLNLSHQFDDHIDWNFAEHGKLWTYNLCYFDFLSQENISAIDGEKLIFDFIRQQENTLDGLEPFPTSVRIINWIKYLIIHGHQDAAINKSLRAQAYLLHSRIEYHLMGNHLLENGFALLFAGIYFNDKKLINSSQSILLPQLKEQILNDGAHFELSPMYHLLILFRILDSINLLANNETAGAKSLMDLLKQKASLMMGWLSQMTFRSGAVPRVNDTAYDIAPDTSQLFAYAHRLGVKNNELPLQASGYRMIRKANYELLIDCGNIGPDYIPGHAHADTFNFILHIDDQPIIVDTGISTYEKNARRQLERSTAAHNTVVVAEKNSSDVWGGFRVGKRAETKVLKENETELLAMHDGYEALGVRHQRKWGFTNKSIEIEDVISPYTKAVAYLHFHPDITIRLKDHSILFEKGDIQIEHAERIYVEAYDYARGFNDMKQATRATIEFTHQLNVTIRPL